MKGNAANTYDTARHWQTTDDESSTDNNFAIGITPFKDSQWQRNPGHAISEVLYDQHVGPRKHMMSNYEPDTPFLSQIGQSQLTHPLQPIQIALPACESKHPDHPVQATIPPEVKKRRALWSSEDFQITPLKKYKADEKRIQRQRQSKTKQESEQRIEEKHEIQTIKDTDSHQELISKYSKYLQPENVPKTNFKTQIPETHTQDKDTLNTQTYPSQVKRKRETTTNKDSQLAEIVKYDKPVDDWKTPNVNVPTLECRSVKTVNSNGDTPVFDILDDAVYNKMNPVIHKTGKSKGNYNSRLKKEEQNSRGNTVMESNESAAKIHTDIADVSISGFQTVGTFSLGLDFDSQDKEETIKKEPDKDDQNQPSSDKVEPTTSLKAQDAKTETTPFCNASGYKNNLMEFLGFSTPWNPGQDLPPSTKRKDSEGDPSSLNKSETPGSTKCRLQFQNTSKKEEPDASKQCSIQPSESLNKLLGLDDDSQEVVPAGLEDVAPETGTTTPGTTTTGHSINIFENATAAKAIIETITSNATLHKNIVGSCDPKDTMQLSYKEHSSSDINTELCTLTAETEHSALNTEGHSQPSTGCAAPVADSVLPNKDNDQISTEHIVHDREYVMSDIEYRHTHSVPDFVKNHPEYCEKYYQSVSPSVRALMLNMIQSFDAETKAEQGNNSNDLVDTIGQLKEVVLKGNKESSDVVLLNDTYVKLSSSEGHSEEVDNAIGNTTDKVIPDTSQDKGRHPNNLPTLSLDGVENVQCKTCGFRNKQLIHISTQTSPVNQPVTALALQPIQLKNVCTMTYEPPGSVPILPLQDDTNLPALSTRVSKPEDSKQSVLSESKDNKLPVLSQPEDNKLPDLSQPNDFKPLVLSQSEDNTLPALSQPEDNKLPVFSNPEENEHP
ncbi:unnamed protein product, partial [Owenia fusiformis]